MTVFDNGLEQFIEVLYERDREVRRTDRDVFVKGFLLAAAEMEDPAVRAAIKSCAEAIERAPNP